MVDQNGFQKTPGNNGNFIEESFLERNHISPITFSLASLLLIFVLYQLVAGGITVFLVGEKITKENVYLVRLLTMLGQILFILVPTLFLTKLLDPLMNRVFKWRMPGPRETFFAAMGLVFLQQIFQIYLHFQDLVPIPQNIQKIIDPIRQMLEEMYRVLVSAESIPELMFVLIVVAFIPAIVEELFFRGLIQGSLERAIAPMRAAIIAGVIFGFYHLNPFALIPLIGLGCYFGVVRVKSNSIIMAMTLHFLNNALAVIVIYFHIEDDLIMGSNSGVQSTESGPLVIQLVLLLILFAVTMMGYHRSTILAKNRNDQSV